MEKVNKLVIYPGTFDPVTYGHIDIIRRARCIFDRIIVAVSKRPSKEALFSLSERINFLKDATKNMPNVKIEPFEGLVVDFVKKKNTNIIIRGIRMISDFEYEFQMALTNRKLASSVETIFMMPSEAYSYLSSKLIKEAAFLGADLSDFVPVVVSKAFDKKALACKNKRRG